MIDKTREEILAITSPFDLFTRNVEDQKSIHRKLVNKWMPRLGSDSNDTSVISHINVLYQKLKDANKPKILELTTINGKKYEISYKNCTLIDLGFMYVGETTVTFLVTKDNKDLYDNGVQFLDSFKYKTTELEKEYSRYFPSIKAQLVTNEHYVLVLEKLPMF